MKVETHILAYVKKNSRKDSLLYNNKCYSIYVNPTDQHKRQYEDNRAFIIDYFDNQKSIFKNDFIINNYNGIPVYYSQKDNSVNTINISNQKFKELGISNLKGDAVYTIFYLRGNNNKSLHSLTCLMMVESIAFDLSLIKMAENCQFWNSEGLKCYNENNTNKNIEYKDFILNCLAADARAFVNANQQFITGKGGNHVWIADATTNERIAILYF